MNKPYLFLSLILPQWTKLFSIFFISPPTAYSVYYSVQPYSVLWYVLNPFSNPTLTYRFYLFGLDTIMASIYCLKKGEGILFPLWQLTSVHWFLSADYANVTVTAFALLVPFSPLLVKLPIGWSWTFSDPHAQFLLSSASLASVIHQALTEQFTGEVAHSLLSYTAILFWTLVSITRSYSMPLIKSRLSETLKREPDISEG